MTDVRSIFECVDNYFLCLRGKRGSVYVIQHLLLHFKPMSDLIMCLFTESLNCLMSDYETSFSFLWSLLKASISFFGLAYNAYEIRFWINCEYFGNLFQQ